MNIAPVDAVVVEFDRDVGWGTVRVVSSGELLGFHCLDIADGSRTIDVGVEVRCRRVGRLGHWQAADLSRGWHH
jgi:hypothetical protein